MPAFILVIFVLGFGYLVAEHNNHQKLSYVILLSIVMLLLGATVYSDFATWMACKC